MATHLKTEVVLAAFDMAVAQRQPAGLVHRSDRGTHYTSIPFGQRRQQAGIRPSRRRTRGVLAVRRSNIPTRCS